MKPRVLLADDSLTIQKVITLTLQGFDLDLSFCKSKDELEEKLAVNDFDILLLDYNISEQINGTDFIKELSQKYPRVKILPLLGTLDDKATSDLSEIGIDQTIIKPFDGNTFVKTFEHVLDIKLSKHKESQAYSELPKAIHSTPQVSTDGDAWTQEVPGVIGDDSESTTLDLPGVISESSHVAAENMEEEPARFPQNDDLAYPEVDTKNASVKKEITSKLVSLDDLDPLGENGSDEFNFSDDLDDTPDRIKDIEHQIEEETKPDLWHPDQNIAKSGMPNLSKSEVRLIAQEVIETYMKESLGRALKEIVPDIAEKIISKEIEKISERILRDDF